MARGILLFLFGVFMHYACYPIFKKLEDSKTGAFWHVMTRNVIGTIMLMVGNVVMKHGRKWNGKEAEHDLLVASATAVSIGSGVALGYMTNKKLLD